LNEYTAVHSQHLLPVQLRPWFRRRLFSRTRRAITGITEGTRAITEDNREIMGGSRAVTEVGREITAAARGVMGATMKKSRSPTCC
jgi:hypothetical protein